MIGLLTQIPQYRLFRGIGYPRKMPLNVTLSVTYACNSRCKTCHVWKRKADDLSLAELELTFRSLGKAPYWFTISGGEPFLRKDLVDICRSIYANCCPGIINIPTNGLLCNTIPEQVGQIAEYCPKTNIIINLSLDGVGSNHDEIRGVPGNWEKAMTTYDALRELRYNNLQLGIHTVISKYNISLIPDIFEYVMTELSPDSYITEIAEQRVELCTIEDDITPSPKSYTKAIDYLLPKIRCHESTRISKITQAFRIHYYRMVEEVLVKKRQIIPCYAGFASAHIAPDGDVWACCIKAEPMGNLREVGYDFGKVWFNSKAQELRSRIKLGECYCPLANASYTNMLMHFRTLVRVGSWVLFSQGTKVTELGGAGGSS